jgi:hypothetical protein
VKTHRALTVSAIILAIGLAGCGEKKAADGNVAEASAPTAGMPATWKATDACSILDKAELAAALKQDVKEAQISLVHEPDASDAGTSECTYLGADGSPVASLMTRWSPINDNSPAAIDGARNAAASALKAFSDKKLEDVPGLGKAAFFVPGMSSLNVFIDDARMIILTLRRVPDGASDKDIAVALARKAGA